MQPQSREPRLSISQQLISQPESSWQHTLAGADLSASQPAIQRVSKVATITCNNCFGLARGPRFHGVELLFVRWHGGGAPIHPVVASQVAAIYVVTFGPDRDLQAWIRQKCALARSPVEKQLFAFRASRHRWQPEATGRYLITAGQLQSS